MYNKVVTLNLTCCCMQERNTFCDSIYKLRTTHYLAFNTQSSYLFVGGLMITNKSDLENKRVLLDVTENVTNRWHT